MRESEPKIQLILREKLDLIELIKEKDNEIKTMESEMDLIKKKNSKNNNTFDDAKKRI